MNIKDIAFACFVYGQITGYDAAYDRFVRATDPAPDFSRAEHCQLLLTWLNNWGCRQFSKACYAMASDAIADWYEKWKDELPALDTDIRTLTDGQANAVGVIHTDLRDRRASVRIRNSISHDVTIGPTGAAKILFSLRPHYFPPGDEPIFAKFKVRGHANSYSNYVVHVRDTLRQLAKLCKDQGFALEELPARIRRPHSTLVKVIDEYYWVTISRGHQPPDRVTLEQWAAWDTH